MTEAATRRSHPHLPYLYEMVISFFEVARETLDPVLQAIDGYRELETDHDGRPAAPDHVARKFAELPGGEAVRYVGACLSATSNLGLAVGAHDFEMEMSVEPLSEEARDEPPSGGRNFRSALAYWQSSGMLHDSHLSLSGGGRASAIRIFIPLRSMIVLDRILASQIAPRLGRDYRIMDQQMSSHTEDPVLKWQDNMVYVSLPDKLGRTLEARWKPTVTSVVRIRESGTEAWSPGFETPFNKCSFVDLKPDTEYDVQVTNKNDVGESEPAITSIKTGPRAE